MGASEQKSEEDVPSKVSEGGGHENYLPEVHFTYDYCPHNTNFTMVTTCDDVAYWKGRRILQIKLKDRLIYIIF